MGVGMREVQEGGNIYTYIADPLCHSAETVTGQSLGFLCPPKLNLKNAETEFGGKRKVTLILR